MVEDIPLKLDSAYKKPHSSLSDDESEPDLMVAMPPTLDAMDYSDVLSYAMSPTKWQSHRTKSASSRTSNTTKGIPGRQEDNIVAPPL